MHRCANAATRRPPRRHASASRQRHPAPGPTRSSRPAGTLPVSACRRPYDSRENMDVLGDCSPRPSPRLAVSLPGAQEAFRSAVTRDRFQQEQQHDWSLQTTPARASISGSKARDARRHLKPYGYAPCVAALVRRSMPTRDPSHPHHHGHPHSSTVLMHVPAPSLSSIAHVFPRVLAPYSAPCRAPY